MKLRNALNVLGAKIKKKYSNFDEVFTDYMDCEIEDLKEDILLDRINAQQNRVKGKSSMVLSDDQALNDSLIIAAECGYSAADLNGHILATLYKTKLAQDELSDNLDQIWLLV